MAWRFDGSLPALARPLGVDRDDHIAYFVSAKGALVGIDLDVRNAQVRLASARQLTAASDGFVFGLDTSGRAIRFAGRSLTTYRTRTVGGDVQLFRAPGGAVSVFSGRERVLQVLDQDGELRRFEVPDGRATASWFGNLVAIANDSGLTLVRQTPVKNDVAFSRVKGTPLTAAFSPSGHRIYVALRSGVIAVIDGFGGHDRLSEIELQGIATRLRTDRSGRWLMAAPEKGDSLWLVDLIAGRVMARMGTPWRDDLPQIVNGTTLLVRSGSDVVAWELSGETPVERKRLEKGAADLYLPVYWLPGRKGTAIAAATPAPAPDSGAQAAPVPARGTDPDEPPPAKAGGEAWYLQVSSSQNPEFARTLADQLTEAGYPAKVLPPETAEQGHRVILGPYPNRDAADAIGKKLGRAYFVMMLDAPDR